MKLTMSYYASSKSPLWMINCELFYSGNKKSPLMSYKNEILARGQISVKGKLNVKSLFEEIRCDGRSGFIL